MTINPLQNIRKRPVRERRAFPDPVYDEGVLRPTGRDADRLLRDAAVQVHRARILDLVGVRTIERDDARAALGALQQVEPEQGPGHHPLEQVTSALAEAGGGRALLGSASEEVDAASMRLVLRERVLDYAGVVLATRSALTTLANSHLTTSVTATSNGQMVQPTTLGHYLTGYLGPLGRTSARLHETFGRLNRSPLGAVSGMATAVPMRRENVAKLLGFDGIIEHTFDALGAADTEFELASTVAANSLEMLRLVNDLSVWARDDIGTIAPGEEFVHHGTAQPQRRDPLVLDHLRIQLTAHLSIPPSLATLLAGRTMLAGTASRYETFFRVEDALGNAIKSLELLNRVLETLDVNRALTANRAHRGFATSSELADLLAVDYGLSRSEAYALAERIATEATILGLGGMTLDTKLVDKLALEVVGREIGIEPETLGKCLSVKRFVERREIIGGPAPAAVSGIIDRERLAASRDAAWIDERRNHLRATRESLGVELEALLSAATS